jgi:hypothetical protein
MIVPSKEYPVLNERPPMEIRRSVHVLGSVFAPLIRCWRAAVMARVNKWVLPNLMEQGHNCCNREELEQLLGKPRYVLSGDGHSVRSRTAEPVKPDLIEVYQTKGCIMEVVFKDDRPITLLGWAAMTPWDAVVSTPFHIRDVKRQRRHRKKLQSFIGSKKEQEVLAKELDPETFRCFLQTYFWQPLRPEDESSVIKLCEYVAGSGNYRTLGELKVILEKTAKLRQAYRDYGTCYSATGEFAILYALVHPEAEETFQGVFFHPDMLTHLKKYTPLTE